MTALLIGALSAAATYLLAERHFLKRLSRCERRPVAKAVRRPPARIGRLPIESRSEQRIGLTH